jgi:hypothetical protein
MGWQFMHKIFISCAVGILAFAPALASDKTDVMAVVHKWGSPDTVVSTCADEAAVVDSVPPYEWHGSGACSKWHNDYDAFTKQNGMTDGHAVVGKALCSANLQFIDGDVYRSRDWHALRHD